MTLREVSFLTLANLNDFINKFRVQENGETRFKYIDLMQKVANRELNQINIQVADLEAHFNNLPELVERIKRNTKRYI